jgi:diguanylate cyclase (GGDEF)-like protein/PAS domain S-box-containing protein
MKRVANFSLDGIRVQATRIFLVACWLHAVLAAAVANIARNPWTEPVTIALAVAVAASLAARFLRDGLGLRIAIAICMTLGPIIFVYAGRGHSSGISGTGDWQIDYHMYFFAVFAMLSAYSDWRPIAVAAALTAGHHLLLDLVVPANVFPEEGLDRVALHAIAVLVECSMLFWLTMKVNALFHQVEHARNTQRIGRLGGWWHDLRTGERHWSREIMEIFGVPNDYVAPSANRPHAAFFSEQSLAAMEEAEKRAVLESSIVGSDHEIVRHDGSRGWVHHEVSADFDAGGSPMVVRGTLHDISDRKAREAELERRARVDALTGLPNRRAVTEHLSAVIESARRSKSMAAVLFVDLNRFKWINDTLGHGAGDELLVELGRRLRKSFRASDLVARMGGDEFVVVLQGVKGANAVARSIRAFERIIAEPVRLGNRDITTTCSIGIAMFPKDGDVAETLVMNADSAMYRAKGQGRTAYRFFSPEMQAAATERMKMETALRAAIVEEALTVHYQAIFSRSSGIVASEALVRWPQADGTVLSPASFIALAEETGLIIPLGSWVLRAACRQNAHWNRDRAVALRVCVNVSAKQIADPDFVDVVRSALEDSGLAPRLLELEITETTLQLDPERCAVVARALQRLGVRISLDDFGTGYNCLTTLRHFRPDTLKLDRSFVAEIQFNAADRSIAQIVLDSAKILGATVVAEGVEAAEQYETLFALDCNEFQGYWHARPQPASDFEMLLEACPAEARSLSVSRLVA